MACEDAEWGELLSPAQEWHQTAIRRAQRIEALEGAVGELLGSTDRLKYVGSLEFRDARKRALELLNQSGLKGWKEIAETYLRRVNFVAAKLSQVTHQMDSWNLSDPDKLRRVVQAKHSLAELQEVLDGGFDRFLLMGVKPEG